MKYLPNKLFRINNKKNGAATRKSFLEDIHILFLHFFKRKRCAPFIVLPRCLIENHSTINVHMGIQIYYTHHVCFIVVVYAYMCVYVTYTIIKGCAAILCRVFWGIIYVKMYFPYMRARTVGKLIILKIYKRRTKNVPYTYI